MYFALGQLNADSGQSLCVARSSGTMNDGLEKRLLSSVLPALIQQHSSRYCLGFMCVFVWGDAYLQKLQYCEVTLRSLPKHHFLSVCIVCVL